MKNYALMLSLLVALAGCNTQKSTPRETVTDYYAALDAAEYDQLASLIADSITMITGDYIMKYSPESYYVQFKWDSVFQTTYELQKVENLNDDLIVTVASRSLRFEFLQNNPMTCQYKITLEAGKIRVIELVDCPGADFDIWQKQVDSLVSWTSNNHPELDGFIYDMTMVGAINYLKAIEWYENRKDGR